MKALSNDYFTTQRISLWDFARLLFFKPQGQSSRVENETTGERDSFSDLHFFQDEGDLESYLQSFRE